MNDELKEMGKQLKEILDKYPNRQKEILFYIFGEDTIREIIGKPTYEELQQKVNQLEQDKTAILLDGNSLINANGKLQQKINQLETNINNAIKIIDNYNCRKGWYENDTDKVIDNIKNTLLERGKE